MTTQCAQVATLKLCVFCNDTATTEIYTLSLHDALPISPHRALPALRQPAGQPDVEVLSLTRRARSEEHRLNSSHMSISYAVFCLKKKKHTSELQSHVNLVCRLLLAKHNTTHA